MKTCCAKFWTKRRGYRATFRKPRRKKCSVPVIPICVSSIPPRSAIYYLDPKLYAVGSRDSSFRTFYFEPKVATNKVRDDAVHLILGFEHETRKAGYWKFTRWDIVDLAHFKVKLKAEFQGSNRDMYRPEAVVATSDQPK